MTRPDRFENPAATRLPIDLIGLVLGPVLMGAWLFFVDRGSLTPEAHRLAGILLLTITWWLTEPVPLAVTGLSAVALAVFLGAVPVESNGRFEPARTALAPFADPSAFFLLGGLFIGRAMERHGLDRRIALSLLCTRWAGRSPHTVLAAVGVSVALVSMWISNTAATAMMYPVTLGIIAVLAAGQRGDDGRFATSPYASALLLMTAYASSVGGIATPIGTATNVVAMGYFRRPDFFGQAPDFLRWCVIGVPMMLLILVGLIAWLRLRAPAAGLDLPALRVYLRQQKSSLGAWKVGEVNTLAVFLLVVGLWVTPGVLALVATPETRTAFTQRFPEEVVALLAPVVLCALPVNWRRREFTLDITDFLKVDWATILLFGSAVSLGGLMFKTGLAQHAGERVFDWLGTNDVWLITAVAIACGILLSEFTSNVAAVTTLLPVILAICRQANVDPLPPVLGVTFAASFGSALPVSTPPNAIVYGSRLIPVRRMIVAGVGLDIICGVVIWLVLRISFALGYSPLP
jgi:sodium-dependent dicarboxylate transporter 2/3/5